MGLPAGKQMLRYGLPSAGSTSLGGGVWGGEGETGCTEAGGGPSGDETGAKPLVRGETSLRRLTGGIQLVVNTRV